MCSCGGVHESMSQVNRTTASCVHNTCLRVYSITLESQNLDNSDDAASRLPRVVECTIMLAVP